MSMSQKVREELLPRLRQRYMGRGKKGRGALLDEVCEQFGYSRKHAIKLLGAKAGWGGKAGVCKVRPLVYGKEVEEVLYRLGKAANTPAASDWRSCGSCGSRETRSDTASWMRKFDARSWPSARRR
jgi:hypothetical protein